MGTAAANRPAQRYHPPGSLTIRGGVMRSILLAWLFACAAGALAQQPSDYPNRAIRIIVPLAAGGNVDIVARTLAEHI
jgi:tripartite-type tricarboxylate transporter receptor subunit TctC